jgi:hypothetical protein
LPDTFVVPPPPSGWVWDTEPAFNPNSPDQSNPGMLRRINSTYPNLAALSEENIDLWGWFEENKAYPESWAPMDIHTTYQGIELSLNLTHKYHVTLYTGIYTRYATQPAECYCPSCDQMLDGAALICPHCEAVFVCGSCPYAGRSTMQPGIIVGDTLACTRCARRCSSRPLTGCGQYTTQLWCSEHSEELTCVGGCGNTIQRAANFPQAPNYHTAGAPSVCDTCVGSYCVECGTVHDIRLRALEGVRLCNEHYNEAIAGRVEQFEEEELLPTELLLTNNLHRPIRVCSLEVETAEGGGALALELYNQGLCSSDRVRGYHHGANRDDFCHVERDSSLGEGGGELIFGRLNLDNEEHLARLHQGMSIVRSLIKQDQLVVDTRCGLHIHIDGHGMGVGHVRNLVRVFAYLEDPLFRIAAARYRRHRGLSYANQIEKQFGDTVRAFGVGFLARNGHTHALNVSHYWQAVRGYCECGAAIVGKYEECECNLGQATFEFRLFNGTSNFRKIHAYAALSQSMVAWARTYDAEEIANDELTPMEFELRRDITPIVRSQWEERLVWMMRNFYFSDTEKDSLLYVMQNSQIGEELGEEKVMDIITTAYEAPAKEPQPIPPPHARRDSGSSIRIDSFDPPDYDPDYHYEEDPYDEAPF